MKTKTILIILFICVSLSGAISFYYSFTDNDLKSIRAGITTIIFLQVVSLIQNKRK